MNQVVLIGNLTRDPELRYSTGGNQTAVCRFTIAVNERRRNPQTQEWEDNANFIPIVVFGKQAENCDRFLAKGRKVAISGRIQTGSYEKDGQKRYTTDVVANNVEFLTPRNESGQGFGQMDQSAPQAPMGGFQQEPGGFGAASGSMPGEGGFGAAPESAPAEGGQELPAGFQTLDDDDIPF